MSYISISMLFSTVTIPSNSNELTEVSHTTAHSVLPVGMGYSTGRVKEAKLMG